MRTKLIESARSNYEKSGGAWTEENGQKVKILMPTYVEGPEEDSYQWRKNITEVNLGEKADQIIASEIGQGLRIW